MTPAPFDRVNGLDMRQSVAHSQVPSNKRSQWRGRLSPELAAAVGHPAHRRYEGSAESILDQRSRDERHDTDQPGLFNAEFHAECQPAEAGTEHDDVSDRH